jgi:pimeloyl-ACP methyl ester carboxylesterase
MECTVRDVPLSYESYGTGTPIILLHGYGSDHRLMKGCIEPIFAQQPGWQRIYLDLPGMGQTPGKEQIKSTDDILDIVIAFLDAVIPGQCFLLAGESYGGYLARGVVYWRGWSQLPPPPALQLLLGRLEQGHAILLYSSA